MAATAIDSLRGILNGFRDLNSKGIYTMNATETDLLRQILIEVQALSFGGLVDGSVTTAKLADNAVTTAKILDANVTTAKILDANVTPAKLNGAQSGSAPIFGVRAWVNFNGTGTVVVLASGNVSSITDRGVGLYTVNFTNAMPDVNYFFSGSCESAGGNNVVCQQSAGSGIAPDGTQKSVSACQIVVSGSIGAFDGAAISAAFLR
jgi:hypothetical protein